MRALYTVAFIFSLPLILLRLWWRGRRNPGYRARWWERFGIYRGTPLLDRPVWIHAVSVGEVSAASPLIKALRDRHRQLPILVTTTTPTGFDTVSRQFPGAVAHVYFPYDVPFVVRRLLRRFRPRALVLMETELWPNVVAVCTADGVPVYLVNARLSARSAERYAILPRMTRKMLEGFSGIAVQNAADAARFLDLGAPAARTQVTGSMKFDVSYPASLREEGAALRRELGVNRPILMAGSTRPGEEEVVLEAFAILRQRHPNCLLVLAPRHPERFESVVAMCRQRGFAVVSRRAGQACTEDTAVFLLDTMGELMCFYAASDVAFVGGSLVPAGGHNVLEPAVVGVPIVVGPHLFNFAEISTLLEAAGALKIVQGAADMAAMASRWMSDSNARDLAGCAGRDVVMQSRGATERTLALLATSLGA
ncbi:MAG: lipid IV(A) 3-deoxy-D-manno-octulosonic acid transferase [Gammaproteobacteria bacterium]|nr:lipid IV(A) 3-deoxy-D-manno-octulosonic acid transferase [Gammaproteobacteria bacterium]